MRHMTPTQKVFCVAAFVAAFLHTGCGQGDDAARGPSTAFGTGGLAPQGGMVVSVTATASGGLLAGGTASAPTLGLLTSCGTGQTLTWGGSSWACGAGGITNSAGNHVIPVSDGTNLIGSSESDDGSTFSTSRAFSASSTGSFGGALNMNSHKVTSMLDPTSAQDGSTKNYVDDAAAISVKTFGAVGDGSTDDTAAIQAALTCYSTGGSCVSGSTLHALYFPSGTYKITNTLIYEGDTGTGVRIVGEIAPAYGNFGAKIAWFGPAADTMILVLGANHMQIENINIDPSPPGGTTAQNALWFDATNELSSSTSYSDSAITRASNVVTATIGTHTIVSPYLVRVAGVTDTSFDGTFRVISYTATTVTWIQSGGNASSSGGTVVEYKSAPSNNLAMNRVSFGAAEGITSTVTSMTGSYPTIALTTTTAHKLTVGDIAIYRGGGATDATYLGAYRVAAIPTATTATLTAVQYTSQSGTGSTGGTMVSGSTGLRFGHAASNTEQVSDFISSDLYFYGDDPTGGTGVSAVQSDEGGNVKDFVFNHPRVYGYRYGFAGFLSPYFTVRDYQAAVYTPDTSVDGLASVDFLQCSPASIDGAETEPYANNRFFYSTAAGSPVYINNVAVLNDVAPSDDIVITANNLTISNSILQNIRTSGSVPYISNDGLGFTTYGASVVSTNNVYTNAAVGSAGPTPGYIPVLLAGNPFGNAGYALINVANVTSTGDMGTTSTALSPVSALLNLGTLGYLTIANGSTVTYGIPDSGSIRFPKTSTIVYKNNAASGNITAMSKDTSDVVHLGDTAGAETDGPLTVTGAGHFVTSAISNVGAPWTGYTVFGPNAAGNSGEGIGIGYDTTHDSGWITAIAPGVAFEGITFGADHFAFYCGSVGASCVTVDSDGTLDTKYNFSDKGAKPTITSGCGTTGASITGGAYSGVITTTTGATSCVLTFATALTGTPSCIVENNTLNTVAARTVTTSALTITAVAGDVYTFDCKGH